MDSTFEDNWGPVSRRTRRLVRAVRWRVKGLLRARRTLLVELNWRLGDEIMALPVLEALHARYPAAALQVQTHYPELFTDNPWVDAVNPADPDPDRYILLRGAPRRVYRLAACCRKAGVPLSSARPRLYYRNWQAPQLARLPKGDGPLLALAPGASWASKRWPADRWRALAAHLEAEHGRVMVLGGPDEGLGFGTDFTGATTVREAACVLHAADVAVCCDSGLMHLALAAGTPVVALFGPTDPDYLIRDEPKLTALRSEQSCRGFWNHAVAVGEPGVCPDGHACCLESITVEDVVRAVAARLAGGRD